MRGTKSIDKAVLALALARDLTRLAGLCTSFIVTGAGRSPKQAVGLVRRQSKEQVDQAGRGRDLTCLAGLCTGLLVAAHCQALREPFGS